MADFRPLLRYTDSFLGRAARATVAGLVRALEEACRLAPSDPARRSCEQVIQELLAELDGSPVSSTSAPAFLEPLPSPPTAPSVAPVTAAGRGRLAAVRTAFLASPEATAELSGLQLPDGSDAEVWRPLQFALLRLSAPAADRWREKILATTGGTDAALLEWLPGPQRIVFPGYAGTPGLGLKPDAPTHAELNPVPHTEPARTLAGVLTVLFWFLEADATLHHGLHGVFNYGLTPLKPDVKRRYRIELLRRWAAFREANNAGQRLEAWVHLDEAIHSLMHYPPATPGSWWSGFLRSSRDTMTTLRDAALEAGHAVQLWEMTGRYAENRPFAETDDQPMPGGVAIGQIVACLRLYFELDGQKTRGRVFFRDR